MAVFPYTPLHKAERQLTTDPNSQQIHLTTTSTYNTLHLQYIISDRGTQSDAVPMVRGAKGAHADSAASILICVRLLRYV